MPAKVLTVFQCAPSWVSLSFYLEQEAHFLSHIREIHCVRINLR